VGKAILNSTGFVTLKEGLGRAAEKTMLPEKSGFPRKNGVEKQIRCD